MLRLACLFVLAGVALGSGYGYQPKTTRCYQCEYRPPRSYSHYVPREEEYDIKVPKTTYDCKEEKVPAGYKYVADEKKEEKKDGYGHGYGYGYHPRSYGHYEPQYTTIKRCYPKVEYETVTKTRTVYDTETRTGPSGGFEPCMGPITAESAKADGVDDWECHSSCYVRVDGYGNVSRGCYKGEFGVNPHHPGPQSINGMTYRFCYGDLCNGEKVEAPKAH